VENTIELTTLVHGSGTGAWSVSGWFIVASGMEGLV